MSRFLCYILLSETGSTYAGCTCDLARRLRQHNGELVGGAKYTRAGRPWKPWVVVEGFCSYRDALRFEWRLKQHRHWHPRLRGAPLDRRRRLLAAAAQWASQHLPDTPLVCRHGAEGTSKECGKVRITGTTARGTTAHDHTPKSEIQGLSSVGPRVGAAGGVVAPQVHGGAVHG